MRITSTMRYGRFLESLKTIRTRIAGHESRLASGRKLERPSDDPSGAAEALLTRSRLASLDRYSGNAAAARSILTTTDSALSSLGGLLSQARSAAIRGASDVVDSGREAIAQEIDSVRSQALALARTSFQGRYVFAGTDTATNPYDDNGVYQGNSGQIKVATGDAETAAANLTGPEVFGAGGGVFATLADLATALRSGDVAGIQAAAGALEAAGHDVSLQRTIAGERIRALDATIDRNATTRLSLIAHLSEIEDADPAEDITRLANDRVAEQAVLATGARIESRSLFDYLG